MSFLSGCWAPAGWSTWISTQQPTSTQRQERSPERSWTEAGAVSCADNRRWCCSAPADEDCSLAYRWYMQTRSMSIEHKAQWVRRVSGWLYTAACWHYASNWYKRPAVYVTLPNCNVSIPLTLAQHFHRPSTTYTQHVPSHIYVNVQKRDWFVTASASTKKEKMEAGPRNSKAAHLRFAKFTRAYSSSCTIFTQKIWHVRRRYVRCKKHDQFWMFLRK